MNLKQVNEDRLRSYSSAFTRRVFSNIANFADFSHLDWLISHYDEPLNGNVSYMDYLSFMYNAISKFYRCEYVYKNEVINQLLLKRYGTKNTIVFNEFKIGNSIVDLAMMNGESKAFEIKTTLDSPKRLGKQMSDYKKVFNKCYIVVDVNECDSYARCVDEATGIVSLSYIKGRVVLDEYRPAKKNDSIDVGCLMKCLRTPEYVNIGKDYFGEIPDVPTSRMYKTCKELLEQIPSDVLNRMFLKEVKKRKSVTSKLMSYPREIRQMMLSLNLPENRQNILMKNLSKTINRSHLCTIRI